MAISDARPTSIWTRPASGRRLSAAVAALAGYFVLLNVGTAFLASATHYRRGLGQLFTLSMSIGYSPAAASAILGRLGPQGRSTYGLTLVAFDLLLPLLYAAALSLGLRRMAGSLGLAPGWTALAGRLPLVAVVANWLADACLLAMIQLYPRVPVSLAVAASVLTTVKLLVIGVSGAAILAGATVVLVRRVVR